jgi:succinoglycan biosynthesis transport protein ExoP
MLKSNAAVSGAGGSRATAVNAALRRGIWLTILLCLVGAVAGGFAGQRLATRTSANATILVNPLDGNPFSTKGSGDDLINLETEAQLVHSDDVARMVQKRAGQATPIRDLLAGLEVNVPPNTQILEIEYTSGSSTTSLSRAQWFAEQYLAYREQRATSLVTSQTKRLEEQITARRKEQSALAKQLSNTNPQSTQAGVLRVQLEAVSTQINQLRARSAELSSVSSNPGQMVTPATIPPSSLLGSWLVYSLAGLIVGSIIAVFIALLRSRADNRIRHVEDIASAGQVLLGEISIEEARTAQLAWQREGSTRELPDAFRALRVNLLTTELRRPAVIVVTTAQQETDAPASVAGLALATAMSNLRTIVIQATDGGLGQVAGTHAASLADVISGTIAADKALVQVRPQLQLLVNTKTPHVDDLLTSPEMHRLVDELRGAADVVLVVTSNVHDSRSKALIAVADSVILEVIQGVSSYRDLYQAANDSPIVAEKLLGVVYVSGHGRANGRATDESADTVAWDSWTRPLRDIQGTDKQPDPQMKSSNDMQSSDPAHDVTTGRTTDLAVTTTRLAASRPSADVGGNRNGSSSAHAD